MVLPDGVKLGVQSWCFHKFKDNRDLIRMIRDCGLDTVELCDEHVNVCNRKEVDEVIKLYRENGITISSFGITDFVNNEATARPVFEFAHKAGISVLGANPDPDSLEVLEKLCNEYSIKLAVHNHGRLDERYGTTEQITNILEKTSYNFGLCLDTGWLIEAGGNPVEVVKKHSDRLYGIHLKDFKLKDDGSCDEVILGTGELDLKSLLSVLKVTGFKGFATIEYEVDPENPVPGIKQCIKSFD